MRIISESELDKLCKEAYLKGLNVGDGIGYQRRKMDENQKGIIMSGYKLDEQLDEILRGK